MLVNSFENESAITLLDSVHLSLFLSLLVNSCPGVLPAMEVFVVGVAILVRSSHSFKSLCFTSDQSHMAS